MSEPLQRFPLRGADEQRVVSFDFALDLDTGETLNGTPTAVVVEVKRGPATDQNKLIAAGTALDAAKKIVMVPTIEVIAAEYTIKVVCATTTDGKILELKAILPVII